MNQLPAAARFYVSFVIVAAGVLLVLYLPQARFQQPVLFIALMALSIAVAAIKVPLPVTTSGSTMSLSCAAEFASLLLLGPHETMLVAMMSALSQCSVNNKEPSVGYRTLFSMASLVITVAGAGLAYRLLGGTGPSMAFSAMPTPLVGAATVYFLLNSGLVAAAVALASGESVAKTWNTNFLWIAPSYFIGAGAAALAAALVARAGYWIAPLTFAPVYMTYRTYKVYMGRIEDQQRHVQETSDLHLATIEALARAIDAKDRTTHMHIRRMQVYAAGLARAAGLSPFDVEGIKTAALLHDIGKLAVPEHILTKPGPLTREEFQRVRIHPQVGAEIIAGVPFPYAVGPVVMSHHERWDGAGYPQGLSGEQIPIGARILSIVDYFDAVSTERPYHQAVSHDTAVRLLKLEAGRALDPRLVPLFVDRLPSLVAELAVKRERPAGPERAEPAVAAAMARAVEPAGQGSAFENIALAHREIYALYEIAQSMGTSLGVADTMALISSKLTKIIPWSSCSLFVHQPDALWLTCRFSTGVDAAMLQNAVLKIGSALADAVARDRRMLVNVDPQSILETAGVPGETQLRSAILCPLYSDDVFIGCLALSHVEPRRYTDEHRRLLEQIAEQAGAVIHNSMVFERTQEESLTDPLTGLPNRRSLFAHLARELARAARLKAEVALIVMDIDDFKAINDTHGHHVGDHALRQMSAALRASLRPYDLSVRYAGDEFIVVLDDCSPEAAEAKRRDLQERIAQIELVVRPGKTLRLAASAGASVFPHDGTTCETLLARADRRMYRDKAARRGGVRLSPSPARRSIVTTDILDAPAPAAVRLVPPPT